MLIAQSGWMGNENCNIVNGNHSNLQTMIVLKEVWKIRGPCYGCHVVAMMVGQGFLSGSPSFSLYNVDYPDCAATVALRSKRTHTLSLSHTR